MTHSNYDIVRMRREPKDKVLFFLQEEIMEFNYKGKRWKNKRATILRRDGYMCQECRKYGRRTPAVTVHHIKHVDEYPELAYINSNLMSLCQACHNKFHPEKGGKRK